MHNIKQILKIFKKNYPQAKIALNYSNTWQLLVAVVLSAQCTDIIVNKVTNDLFRKYKTLDDYVKADLSDFEKNIKSTGFYHNKAKNILASAKIVKKQFKGMVPNSMKDLLTLPGVARKTANIILGNAYNIVEGIAVDTHVNRISQRLRLVDLTKIGGKKNVTIKKDSRKVVDYIKDADSNKIEQELMKVIPQNDWFKLTYRVIEHGRDICKAQNPKCDICPFKSVCPASRS